jgi:hypothetical protein
LVKGRAVLATLVISVDLVLLAVILGLRLSNGTLGGTGLGPSLILTAIAIAVLLGMIVYASRS